MLVLVLANLCASISIGEPNTWHAGLHVPIAVKVMRPQEGARRSDIFGFVADGSRCSCVDEDVAWAYRNIINEPVISIRVVSGSHHRNTDIMRGEPRGNRRHRSTSGGGLATRRCFLPMSLVGNRVENGLKMIGDSACRSPWVFQRSASAGPRIELFREYEAIVPRTSSQIWATTGIGADVP